MCGMLFKHTQICRCITLASVRSVRVKSTLNMISMTDFLMTRLMALPIEKNNLQTRNQRRIYISNREADQRLCFRYSTIPILSKSKISSL